MNKLKMISIRSALAVFLCGAASAFAVSITPPGPGGAPIPFSAVGATSVSKIGVVVGCNTVFNGTVGGNGSVLITGAAFTGNALCHLIKANVSATSPWTGHVDTPTQLVLDNVSVTVNASGQCGPSKMVGTISDNGRETVIGLHNAELSGGCSISGSLTTTPYLHVK